jgi:hypothetical protein
MVKHTIPPKAKDSTPIVKKDAPAPIIPPAPAPAASQPASTAAPLPFIKQKRATKVEIIFSSGDSIDTTVFEIKVTFKDHNEAVMQMDIRECPVTFFRQFYKNLSTRYEAIDRYNPSHYQFFIGSVVERIRIIRHTA